MLASATHALACWRRMESLGGRMQRLSMAKKFLSSCHWNCRGVFFLLGRRMVLVMGQFVIGDAFFLFSSLLPRKSHSPFKILELSFYLLRFQLQYLFFWFLIFIFSHFVKFWFVFNFILWSPSFWFCIFILLLNWLFFSISQFSQKFVIVLQFSFLFQS
jgi:hypothetical protein